MCVITSNCDFLKAVEETFEQDLHQAILLSKLDYEERLVNAAKTEKEQEQCKKGGKRSKKSTMSLEEFNNMKTNTTQVPVITSESEENKSKGMILWENKNVVSDRFGFCKRHDGCGLSELGYGINNCYRIRCRILRKG